MANPDNRTVSQTGNIQTVAACRAELANIATELHRLELRRAHLLGQIEGLTGVWKPETLIIDGAAKLAQTRAAIAGRRKVTYDLLLESGPRRFNELLRRLQVYYPSMSKNHLTTILRDKALFYKMDDQRYAHQPSPTVDDSVDI